MKVWNTVLMHVVSASLIVVGCDAAVLPLEAQQAVESSSAKAPGTAEARLENLPDSPGVVQSSGASESESQEATRSQSNSSQSNSSSSQTSQSQQAPQTSDSPQKPVGTAAAESSN